MSDNKKLPCYALCGPEIGKRNAFIKDVIALWTRADGAPPERYTFYAGETSVGELLGVARNGSLFSSRRVIEYRNAEALTTKADIAAMADYAKDPDTDAVLFLITDAYSLPKAIETAIGPAGKLMFWELREFEKPAWVREELSHYGLTIDDDGLSTLFELVENETSALDSACTMLAAYFPQGQHLTSNNIESTLSKSREEDAFSLFDRMAIGRLDTALEVLDTLLADRQSDATQIVAALVWSLRKTERLHFLSDVGTGAGREAMSMDAAFSQEKVTTKTAQRRFKAAMQRYSAKDCSLAVRACSATEAALRSGLATFFERPLLQLLIVSIMSKEFGQPALSGWKEEEYYRFY
ncbi:MAG: DNA polymerase III subunit delta [Rectinema sp.]